MAVVLGCLIINFVYFWLIRRNFDVFFATNDDYRMRLIVSGAYTGTPSNQMVFINAILGGVLSLLYRISPGVEWYGLFYLFSVYVFACTVESLFLCGAKRFGDFIVRILCVAVFSAVILPNYLLMPQFTTISAIWTALSATACLAFLFARKRSWRKFWAIVYLISVLMAVLIRNKMFQMFLPMEVVYCVAVSLNERRSRKGARRRMAANLAVLFGACCILGACTLADRILTGSAQYKSFMEFRVARADLYDYSGWADYNENKEFYDSIGFSRSAWECMNARTFDVNPAVDVPHFKAIYEYTESLNEGSFLQKAMKAVAGSLESLSNDEVIREIEALMVMLLLAFVLVRRSFRSPFYRFLFWGSVLYCALILILLLFWGRIMPRIVQSINLVLTAVSLYFIGEMDVVPAEKGGARFMEALGALAKWGFALVAVLALVLSSVMWHSNENKIRHSVLENRTNLLYAMEDYMRDRPDQFLFYNALQFIAGSDYVFNSSHEGIVNMDSLGNWNVFSPNYYKRNARFGFTSALDGFLNHNVLYAELGSTKNAPIESTLNDYGKTLVKVDEIRVPNYVISIYNAADME